MVTEAGSSAPDGCEAAMAQAEAETSKDKTAKRKIGMAASKAQGWSFAKTKNRGPF
jgi:hypothetical protein